MIQQGRSMNFTLRDTDDLRRQLKDAHKKFKQYGERDIWLAEEIDCLRFELRSRSSVKAAETRKLKKV